MRGSISAIVVSDLGITGKHWNLMEVDTPMDAKLAYNGKSNMGLSNEIVPNAAVSG